MADERQRVSDYWSDQELAATLGRIHWMASPVVRGYLNQLASGYVGGDWLRATWQRHVAARMRPREGEGGLRVLVLGCGGGWLERSLVQGEGGAGSIAGSIASIDACDVADGAVEEARRTAQQAGLGAVLRYHVVDLNHEPPPGGPFDVAVAHSVLHHVENLEDAVPALAASLVPGGLLIVNEYVGPSRFQYGDDQGRMINELLRRLPERLRQSAVLPGAVYPHKERPTVAQMIATDPSESVRSAELLDFLRGAFEVLEERPYGGTLLQHLLYDVVQNFDPACLGDSRLLGLLCLVEEALIREGRIASDYALVVARRADAVRPGRKGCGTTPGDGGGAKEVAADLEAPVEPQAAEGPAAGGRGGLWLQADGQPVPVALPVRALHEPRREPGHDPGHEGDHDPGSEPESGEPRRRPIHSRPLRDRRHGLDLPPVRRHLHRLATGDPACDWTTWVLDELLPRQRPEPPPGRALVVAEPGSSLAERLAAHPAVGGLDLLEPHPIPPGGAVPAAAAAQPLSFRLHSPGPSEGRPLPAAASGAVEAAPPSRLRLPAATYSLVFTGGWLGRCSDRRGLARQLLGALQPGGLLVGEEWLGSPDGRTSPRTLAYARQVAELLQPVGAPGPDRWERWRGRWVGLEHAVLRWVRSAPKPGTGRAPDLEDLLGDGVEILVHRATGGALLQRVLAEPLPELPFAASASTIATATATATATASAAATATATVDAASEAGGLAASTAATAERERESALAFVDVAAWLEERLTAAGVLGSEYAAFVARRRR